MQNSILLQQELHQLHTLKKHQNEKKKTTQAFIQDEGSLTGDEGLQRLRERERAIIKIPAASTVQ